MDKDMDASWRDRLLRTLIPNNVERRGQTASTLFVCRGLQLRPNDQVLSSTVATLLNFADSFSLSASTIFIKHFAVD